MKCSNCGKPIEEGRLFCLYCGHEVQWVPDYDSFGSYMEQERIKKKQAEEEAARHRAALAAELRKKKKRRRQLTLVAACLFLLLCAGLGVGLKLHTDNRNYNDFDYQMRMADTAFSNHKYEESYEFVQRAVTLNPENTDAQLLKAQILVNLEREDEAIDTLHALLAQEPDNVGAYNQLIKIYYNNDQADEIEKLLADCGNEEIVKRFSSYISEPPVFSLPEGEYQEQKSLQLYSKDEGSSIYYTDNGTDPTENSTLYTGAIEIGEGTTTIKAIAVNKRGIVSDIVSCQYVVTFEPPDPPQISPSSGKFTTDMDTRIYVIVPQGCRAYYAFNKKPTITDELYDENRPVEMPEGTNTFYAILVDEHGKVSYPGSAIYTLTEPE